MKLTIITGDNGSGKSCIKDLLLSRKYLEIISHTNREPRPKEKEGKDYYFVNYAEFKIISFVEQIDFGNKKYGISLKEMMTKLKTKRDLVVIAEPNGVIQLLKWLTGMEDVIEDFIGEKLEVNLIHLIVPYEWRFFRILKENLSTDKEQGVALFDSIKRMGRDKDIDELMKRYISDQHYSKIFRTIDDSEKYSFTYLPIQQSPFPTSSDDLEDVPMEVIENLLVEKNIIKKKVIRNKKSNNS